MPRELIAPERERVAFRDYPRQPLAPEQVRVRSEFGAAKHGSEMSLYQGYGSPRGRYDNELGIFIHDSGGTENYPAVLGNMCIGEVIETGSAYPAGLDVGAEAHFNRPSIVFSRACSEPNPAYPNWDEERLFEVSWRLLSDGSLSCDPVVQPVVAFDELLTEYPKIATAPEENVKLGVRF